VQDRAIVATANQHKVLRDLSTGAIFNDFNDSLTQISRSRYFERQITKK